MKYCIDSIQEGTVRLVGVKNSDVEVLVPLESLPEECSEGDLIEGDQKRGFRALERATGMRRRGLFLKTFQELSEK